MSDLKEKKTRFSLNFEQKYAIIQYRDKNPNKKQKDLIEYFNKLFKCDDKLSARLDLIREKSKTQANIENYMAPLVEQLKITNNNNNEHFKID